MRYAVKLAYDGTRFAGSQVQPGQRTVHGEVARALEALTSQEAPALRWAGRTDAGVSARGNVVAFETDLPGESLLASLTFRMEDAWAWALARVGPEFEPRHARTRWYRYHLREQVEPEALQEALRVFEGEHDFTAFCRLEPGVNPVRFVESIRVQREGPLLLIDVVGENFLWNQVRRMVEAGRRAATGEIGSAALADALRTGRGDFGVARPEGLVLMDVAYATVTFEQGPDKLAQRLRARLDEQELSLAVTRAVMPP